MKNSFYILYFECIVISSFDSPDDEMNLEKKIGSHSFKKQERSQRFSQNNNQTNTLTHPRTFYTNTNTMQIQLFLPFRSYYIFDSRDIFVSSFIVTDIFVYYRYFIFRLSMLNE